jgi:hypothetical protein
MNHETVKMGDEEILIFSLQLKRAEHSDRAV